MSTDGGLDDEPLREGPGGEAVGERAHGSVWDEDLATRFTRGVVDGFTEASQAFSHELEGTNRFPELMGRSVAGVIRANARLLDEVATVIRQAAEGLGDRPPKPAEVDLDYERLADLVAARLASIASGPVAAEPTGTARSRRKA